MRLSRKELADIKAWLDRDPVGNAYIIGRAFFDDESPDILVNSASDPQAILVIQKEKKRLVLGASVPEEIGPLLDQLPRGSYRVSSLDLDLVATVSESVSVYLETPAWLFEMSRDDFRPFSVCETKPVNLENARMIAEKWWPEGDASEYVMSRIKKGPSAGVYVDEELVAWDMTHLVTDRVVMLGFLFVKEEFRGRGYAKSVCTAMCEKVFLEGKIPACQVYEDNEPSMVLTESMGFRRLKRQAWGTVTKR